MHPVAALFLLAAVVALLMCCSCSNKTPASEEECSARRELRAALSRGEDPDACDDRGVRPVVTREQGLALLHARVAQKPDADTEEEALAFLRFFRDNRERWKVTRSDLVRIYREAQPNLFAQLGQYRLSRRATAAHGGVGAFLGE